ncbi:AMP-binding protein [Nonlabens sp. Asnod3-H03]|uniref:AMP-binding protein n=1 Tax=Nonlabens sp. Asnod3-H03 TaxID=3160580 RepID=UPI00386322D8
MIPKIHPTFKLNGRHLNHQGVMIVAYSYVKEGTEWEKEVGDFLLNWLDDFDVMTVFTSGSTGSPRQYKLNKQHMINSAIMTGEHFDLGPGTEALCCLPLSYIAGKMMMVRALMLGWEIDLVKPNSNPLKKAEKRYDFTAMTPMQVKKSLKNIHKTKMVLIGGAAIRSQLIDDLQHKHTKAFHSYGMTETASHVAIKQLYPKFENEYTAVGDINFSQDNRDCLVINAPSLGTNNLITNDIVELIDEHKFKILGRIDDVINTGGIKIHPDMVEQKMAAHIAQRFFITGMNDEDLGEKVILIVEGKESDLQQAFTALDKYEIPKEVYFINSFEETHTKKVDKRSTLERLFRK